MDIGYHKLRNVIDEKTETELHARLLSIVNFVRDEDLANKNVLDIGCGHGWFEINAIDRGVKRIIATELSEKDLEIVTKHINQDEIDFVVCNAKDLPFEDNSFDTVVSWEVLEHVPKGSEDGMFREVRRVLVDNGVFYLSTPYRSMICTMLDPAWWLIRHRHYNEKQIERLSVNNGFTIEDISIKSGWWEIIGIWQFYISKWILRGHSFFPDFFRRKQDAEQSKEKGFVNMMARCRAIKDDSYY